MLINSISATTAAAAAVVCFFVSWVDIGCYPSILNFHMACPSIFPMKMSH